ncbi:putative urea ABC transporter substrate-binding protein [Motilimonas eburnea]|uniref:putative urea ABC transporter substrate-binding protein n=1 Tax=Motilimonas eburnea TaxID=1737488 RepID=UPI001E4B5F4E|nr:putative urea ABC transporter substrate-binding protein [Motilimonas eburnea]MCE2571367.1 putative urea ABC transporter substrate-binding protein [Motilimonas eburnea]
MLKQTLAALTLSLASLSAHAADEFKVCWSHYTGWEPWSYAQDSGILDKWAKKYDITIQLDLINDYIESINLYTSGLYDACTMTQMDALTIPAVGGVDSTALILGDYSNGNDGIVIKQGSSVADLKGREVMLVELSVSHYLLARALDKNGLSEQDVKVVNTSDADIASLFQAAPDANVVTWNPPLQQVTNTPNAKLVFDSSMIPGEILDLMVVKTQADERLKKALTGAWYEVMQQMAKGDDKALNAMASSAGGSLAEFNAQLTTTNMFYQAEQAVAQMQDKQLIKTMEYVRSFSFDHGLYGNGAPSKDLVGISFPDGSVLGDNNNIKLRFDASYMQLAAENKL